MILQDLLNQYIAGPALQAQFLEQHGNAFGALHEEVTDVAACAQAALVFLNIPEANTPHVTNTDPSTLPPPIPVVVTPEPVPTPVPTAAEHSNGPVVDVVASEISNPAENARQHEIAALKARLVELEGAA